MKRLGYRALRLLSSVQRFFRERLTGAGWTLAAAAGVAAAAGIDTNQSVTYQAFAFLGALLALAWAWSPFLRARVDAARALPRYATVGEPLSYELTVENLGPRRLAGALVVERLADPRPSYAEWRAARDPESPRRNWWDRTVADGFFRWQWAVERRTPRALREQVLPELAPGERCTVRLEMTPRRRGRIELRGVTLGRPEPLGLVKGLTRVAAPGRVTALPRRYRVPELALPGRRKFQPGGVSLATSIGDSEEFVGLRDYRPGDPLHRLHWRSFARTGRPIVREFQDEYFERHALVLDTAREEGEDEVFEEAVAVAASFVYTIDTRECLLDLLFAGAQAHAYTAGRGQMSAEHLLEVLAAVSPAPGRFEEIAAAVRGRMGETSSFILVLVAWDEARRRLAESLRAAGVEVRALLVSREPPAGAPAWLRVLEPGRIEAGLARL